MTEETLRLRWSRERGRGLYATRALAAGEELLHAPAFAFIADAQHCGHCASAGRGEGDGGAVRADAPAPRGGGKLLRCACGVAYCGVECQRAEWSAHKVECGVLARRPPGAPLPPATRLVARVIRRLAASAPARALEPARARPAGAGLPLDAALAAELSSAAGVRALHVGGGGGPDGGAAREQAHEIVPLLTALVRGAGGRGADEPPAALPSAPELEALLRAVRCNAFTTHDSELRPTGIGLFPLAATLNHSCAPNAVVLFDGARGGARVRAVAAVPAGDEVTIAYVDVAAPTPLRRAELLAGYDFACACRRCARYAAAEEDAPAPGEGDAPLAAFTPDDLALLGARCDAAPGGRPCAGLFAVEVFSAPPERGGGTLLHTSPCSACGATPSRARLRRVDAALEGIEGAVAALRPGGGGASGGSGAAHARAEAALAAADAVLSGVHHRVVALVNAMLNESIAREDFAAAEALAGRLLAAGRAAHPPGHPVPALHGALLGKLLLLRRRPADAAAALAAAVDALAASHGGDAPLVRGLRALLTQAQLEAAAAVEG